MSGGRADPQPPTTTPGRMRGGRAARRPHVGVSTPRRRPTPLLLGMALVASLLAANALLWAVGGALYASTSRDGRTDADGRAGGGAGIGILLLAWTTGLRHALDADHICAIDNAVRRLLFLGRSPLLVGTFFALGHSTVVVVAAAVVSASLSLADRVRSRFGDSVGSVVGPAVSASFLALVGVVNAVLLWKAWRRYRGARRSRRSRPSGRDERKPDEETRGDEAGAGVDRSPHQDKQGADDEGDDKDKATPSSWSCFVRAARPLLRAVDRAWKMYVVGLLFGLGFDTAGTIILLGVVLVSRTDPSSPAQSPSSSSSVAPSSDANHSRVMLLAFLFTAGMTLIDSLDCLLMTVAYSAPASRPRGDGEGGAEDEGRDDRAARRPRTWWWWRGERWRLFEAAPDAGASTQTATMDAESGVVGALDEPLEQRPSDATRGEKRGDEVETAAATGPAMAGGSGEARQDDVKGARKPTGTEAEEAHDVGASAARSDDGDGVEHADARARRAPLDAQPCGVAARPTPPTPGGDATSSSSALGGAPAALSLWLTLLSVLLALSISLVVGMGVVAERCRPCALAADAHDAGGVDGGGLAGAWWSAWRRANDESGWIGLGIVAAFAVGSAAYAAAAAAWRRGRAWGAARRRGGRRRGDEEAGPSRDGGAATASAGTSTPGERIGEVRRAAGRDGRRLDDGGEAATGE